LINMIGIGFFARRKGLNGAQIAAYVALACFFNVFAWICVLSDVGKKTKILVSDGRPLAPYPASPKQSHFNNSPHQTPDPSAVRAPQFFFSPPPAPYPAVFQDPYLGLSRPPSSYPAAFQDPYLGLSRPPSSYPAAFQDPYAGLYHVVPSGQLNQNPAPHITPHPGPQLPQNANL
jgi:hypothetical protein